MIGQPRDGPGALLNAHRATWLSAGSQSPGDTLEIGAHAPVHGLPGQSGIVSPRFSSSSLIISMEMPPAILGSPSKAMTGSGTFMAKIARCAIGKSSMRGEKTSTYSTLTQSP